MFDDNTSKYAYMYMSILVQMHVHTHTQFELQVTLSALPPVISEATSLYGYTLGTLMEESTRRFLTTLIPDARE